jgi:hypothetical protein
MRVGYVREDGYEGVHFEDDDGNTLGIERADEFDEADIAAGMDTYCIVLGLGPSGLRRRRVVGDGHPRTRDAGDQRRGRRSAGGGLHRLRHRRRPRRTRGRRSRRTATIVE